MTQAGIERASAAEKAAAEGPRPLPDQGADGLFQQSWYPICQSSELAAGVVIDRDFLDGKIILFRGEDGTPTVASAYCPHLGANLVCGTLIGNAVRCAFHHWEFDSAGACVRTGAGDRAPSGAKLFVFPSQERFGIIWAFNGVEPLWPLPDFAFPDSELQFHNYCSERYTCDGWMLMCNTPDMQHIKVVHKFDFKGVDPHELVDWTKWDLSYPLKAAISESVTIDWRVGIHGTTIFVQQGLVQDWWMGIIVGMSCPRPGHTTGFASIALKKGDGSQAQTALNAERFEWAEAYGKRIAAEDAQIMNTIRFRPTMLTRVDRTLAKFFDFLRAYPRAHPSAKFIR